MLSLCPFDISLGVEAFVIGLDQISSFLSWKKWTILVLFAHRRGGGWLTISLERTCGYSRWYPNHLYTNMKWKTYPIHILTIVENGVFYLFIYFVNRTIPYWYPFKVFMIPIRILKCLITLPKSSRKSIYTFLMEVNPLCICHLYNSTREVLFPLISTPPPPPQKKRQETTTTTTTNTKQTKTKRWMFDKNLNNTLSQTGSRIQKPHFDCKFILGFSSNSFTSLASGV